MSEEDFRKIGEGMPVELRKAMLASPTITRAAMEKELEKARSQALEPKLKSYQQRAFSIVAKYDSHGDIFWHADFSFVGVFCSDFFAWACADCETIESDEDVDALEQAYKDVIAAYGSGGIMWGPELYAARKRKWAPASFVKFSNDKIKALFDAIGGKQHE